MKSKSNTTKDNALGMPHGTAQHRLRKSILFDLLLRYGENICFNCGLEIETVDSLSIEHKQPWLYSDNPSESFFDLDNIAFSHLTCNRPHSYRHANPREHNGLLRCGRCQEYKSYDEFGNATCRKSGKQSNCRSCRMIVKRERRARGVVP